MLLQICPSWLPPSREVLAGALRSGWCKTRRESEPRVYGRQRKSPSSLSDESNVLLLHNVFKNSLGIAHKELKQQFVGAKPSRNVGNLTSVFVFLAEGCFFRQIAQRVLCRMNGKLERQMSYKA